MVYSVLYAIYHILLTLSDMKVTVFILWAFLLPVLVGCSDDDATYAPLTFGQTYYEKPLLMNEAIRKIAFTGGSGDFSLSVSNSNILDAKISNGAIVLTPKEKGRTNIEVRDNADDRSVTIQVKVVDPYLAFSVHPHVPCENPFYEEGDYLFFVNDENRSVYWFDKSFNLKAKGHDYSFSFVREPTSLYLSLTYSEGVRAYVQYEISGDQTLLFSDIPTCLGDIWEERLPKSRAVANESPLKGMQAVDMETGDEYDFVERSIEMPYGMLN